MSKRKKHIVIVSNLYPNSQQPTFGIFTEQLCQRLLKYFDIKVIAPVPWAPFGLSRLKGRPQLPDVEVVNGVTVYHPGYVVIPKTARCTYGATFGLCVLRVLRRIHAQKPIELINVHWAYPDGFGTVWAARRLNIPVVLHTLGCDINDYTQYYSRRKMIQYALKRSNLNIHVSPDLRNKALELGSSAKRNRVILNGVDQKKFYPQPAKDCRTALQWPQDKTLVLYVGNFNPEKGVIHLLDAWHKVMKNNPQQAKQRCLYLVGSGPQEALLKARVQQLGVSHSVRFMGRLPHENIPQCLSAADLLVLPSLREGCPNIVLESLSCGTPVVSSAVGAVPELLRDVRGKMAMPGDSDSLAGALEEALQTDWSQMPAFEWMSWQQNADAVRSQFEQVMGVTVHGGLPGL